MYKCNANRYITRKIEGKYLFLDLQTGEAHLLDEIGSSFFDIIIESAEIDEAVDSINILYSDAEREEIKNDIEDFISTLLLKEVIIKSE